MYLWVQITFVGPFRGPLLVLTANSAAMFQGDAEDGKGSSLPFPVFLEELIFPNMEASLQGTFWVHSGV